MHTLLAIAGDARFALRMLRRSPLFTAAAMMALGVGIAASTAIFSLIDAVLRRPMPGVKAPAELVVFERWQGGRLLGEMGYPDYRDYRDLLKSFAGVAAEAGTRALMRDTVVAGARSEPTTVLFTPTRFRISGYSATSRCDVGCTGT